MIVVLIGVDQHRFQNPNHSKTFDATIVPIEFEREALRRRGRSVMRGPEGCVRMGCGVNVHETREMQP
jgi:hypothetical protein